MTEKRKYIRIACSIKAEFDYFKGDPEKIDIDITEPEKGKGQILDLSPGGLFLVSNNRVSVNSPIRIYFKTPGKSYEVKGRIIRTGLLENNPTDVAVKYSSFSRYGDTYIGIEFDKPIDNFSESDLLQQ